MTSWAIWTEPSAFGDGLTPTEALGPDDSLASGLVGVGVGATGLRVGGTDAVGVGRTVGVGVGGIADALAVRVGVGDGATDGEGLEDAAADGSSLRN
jgi:hypothetical protein